MTPDVRMIFGQSSDNFRTFSGLMVRNNWEINTITVVKAKRTIMQNLFVPLILVFASVGSLHSKAMFGKGGGGGVE